jgi:hypothetical protein
MCSVKGEVKELRLSVSQPYTYRTVRCSCVVCGGWRVIVHVSTNRRHHPKGKKRKALGTHHNLYYRSRRNRDQISGKSDITFTLIYSFILFPSAETRAICPVFALTTEPRDCCSYLYRDFETGLRCLYGAKVTAPPSRKRNPRNRLLESFSLGELVVGGL